MKQHLPASLIGNYRYKVSGWPLATYGHHGICQHAANFAVRRRPA
ncbi:hypothetical protein ACFSJU_11910 [Paradesertivirga mongoliensis]|uniref:Uncharacterized protein n=1 Tax=Paradesertivirga mongoliensis TaxID=2100740 RepID=A0ABW4ZME1_9SPHI|nr:hypothetical protein [Pedobacter mongoliensis]